MINNLVYFFFCYFCDIITKKLFIKLIIHTKNLIKMRSIKVLAIVAVAALAGVFVACNKDDDCYEKVKTESFSNDLEELKIKQQGLIECLKSGGTRAASVNPRATSFTMDDVMVCAKAIDEVSYDFIDKHSAELIKGIPANIADEDLDILYADAEKMQEYISANFSPAFVEELNSYLTTGVRNQNLDCQMSSFELFVLQNITSEYELTNLVDVLVNDNQKPIVADDEKNCLNKFNYSKNLCNLLSGFVNLAGLCLTALAAGGTTVVASPFTGGYVGVIGESITSVAAVSAYTACVLKAKNEYDNCKKNINEKNS